MFGFFIRLFSKKKNSEFEIQNIRDYWKEEGTYYWEKFSSFVNKVYGVGTFGESCLTSKEMDNFRKLSNFPVDVRGKMGLVFIEYFSEASIEELTAVDLIFKNIFQSPEKWDTYDQDFKIEVSRKAWSILIIYNNRIKGLKEEKMREIMDGLNRAIGYIPTETEPQKYVFKVPALEALHKSAENILSRNVNYKTKFRTISNLIIEADSLKDKKRQTLAISQLGEKIKEHDNSYVSMPMDEMDRITYEVISERLARI